MVKTPNPGNQAKMAYGVLMERRLHRWGYSRVQDTKSRAVEADLPEHPVLAGAEVGQASARRVLQCV